jgi:hypothetical protein
MTDHDTMRDEGLAIGQPLVIWLSVVERFIDERPATLVRVDVDDATGARRLLVRDETNGVLRSFVKHGRNQGTTATRSSRRRTSRSSAASWWSAISGETR